MADEKQDNPEAPEGSDQVENDPRGEGIEGGSAPVGTPTQGPSAADVPEDAKSEESDEE
jgi:hypothetical protein